MNPKPFRTFLPLALVLLVAAAAAWVGMEARARHRQAALGVVEDYVDFAVASLSRQIESRLARPLFYAFRSEEVRAANEELATVDDLAGDPQESNRCPGLDRYFVRYVPGTGALDVRGAVSEAERAWLLDHLERRAQGSGVSEGVLGDPPGRPSGAAAYRIRRRGEDVVAVFALSWCFLEFETNVFETAGASGPFLPRSLVGDQPLDSLMGFRVLSPGGDIVYASAAQYQSAFGAEQTWGAEDALEGFRLEATLRPEIADRLVRGGIPTATPALGVALLAALGLLGLATAYQFNRTLALVRLRDGFIADVSHELRTPLQQILSWVQLLRMERVAADEREESLVTIERETHRLIGLVDRILTFARTTQLPAPGILPMANVGHVLRSVGEGVELIAREAGVQLRSDCSPELRAAIPEDDLRQILVNLVDNAIKHGGRDGSVDVEARLQNEEVVIDVMDRGPGIPSEDRVRVLLPFERGRGENLPPGSGLGLAIARDLSARAGGSVEVLARANGGAHLRLRLPPG